jgi:hypothetical protein
MKTLVITLFALAMGLLEAAVVVYLRTMYYPAGFKFPMVPMDQGILLTELLREAATIIMLVMVAYLSAQKQAHRFAWFLYAFAVWDLAYYGFLRVIIQWPATFMDWDILFLIPVIWTGPVVAPLLICMQMILLAFLILRGSATLNRSSNLLLVSGAFICLMAFMYEFVAYHLGAIDMNTLLDSASMFIPTKFPWAMFLVGFGISSAGIGMAYYQSRNLSKNTNLHIFI